MATLIRNVVLAAGLVAATASAEMLDRVLVVVNDDVITESEFANRVRIIGQQIEQSGARLPALEQLQAQVLEHMVMGRLQMQTAERFGISVTRQELEQELNGLAQRNNMTPAQFQREVVRSGVYFPAFTNYFYEQLVIQRLQQIEARRLVRVTDEEISNFLRLHSDRLQTDTRYRLGHILIALSSQASVQEASQARQKAQDVRQRGMAGEHFASLAVAESDGRNALAGGDLGWRSQAELPAVAAEIIPDLEVGEITPPLRSSSGYHLFHLAAKEGGDQVMVNQTRARHILLRTHALVDDAEAQARLNVLKKRVEGGDDFAELARAHSDDTASAVDGGDLSWRSPGELDPYFEEQMNRLDIDAVSEPFKTSFGWHIVQVQERRRVDETEQTRRLRAINYLAESRVNEAIEIWLRQMLENAYIHYLVDFENV